MTVDELRRSTRHRVQLPIALKWGKGKTRDVSASGVYFETDEDLHEGESIQFVLTLGEATGEEITIRCEGSVIRLERHGQQSGVAVEMTSIDLDSEASRQNLKK